MQAFDGPASLILLGDQYVDSAGGFQVPVWVYVDDIRVEGAQIVNGDFERLSADGRPETWRTSVNGGVSIRDPNLAASGPGASELRATAVSSRHCN